MSDRFWWNTTELFATVSAFRHVYGVAPRCFSTIKLSLQALRSLHGRVNEADRPDPLKDPAKE
jgi:hypothetical protein